MAVVVGDTTCEGEPLEEEAVEKISMSIQPQLLTPWDVPGTLPLPTLNSDSSCQNNKRRHGGSCCMYA